MFFSCMKVRVGPWRRLSSKGLMLSKCHAGEDAWESLGQRRSNQSILKEINPEYSLEGLMLKLKLQYFGHLMGRADSLEKTLMLGKIEGRRRRGWQKMRWLDGITNSVDMSWSKLQEKVKAREAWKVTVHRVTNSGTWLKWHSMHAWIFWYSFSFRCTAKYISYNISTLFKFSHIVHYSVLSRVSCAIQ